MKLDLARDPAPAAADVDAGLEAPKPRLRLGEVLRRYDLISEAQLDGALEAARQAKERLGQALVRLGLLTQEQINWALAHHLAIPYVELGAEGITAELINRFPEGVLREAWAVPLLELDDELRVAFADPTDEAAVEAVAALARKPLGMALADADGIVAALDLAYAGVSEPPPRPLGPSPWEPALKPLEALQEAHLRGHGLGVVLGNGGAEPLSPLLEALVRGTVEVAEEAAQPPPEILRPSLDAEPTELAMLLEGRPAVLPMASAGRLSPAQWSSLLEAGLVGARIWTAVPCHNPLAGLRWLEAHCGPAALAAAADVLLLAFAYPRLCEGCAEPLDAEAALSWRRRLGLGPKVTLMGREGCKTCGGSGALGALRYLCAVPWRGWIEEGQERSRRALEESMTDLLGEIRGHIAAGRLDPRSARQLPWRAFPAEGRRS